jgi:hypothetical protein
LTSAPETRSIAYTIQTMSPRVKAFLTFHSYGQVWAMPWVHSPNPPEDYDDLIQVSFTNQYLFSLVLQAKWYRFVHLFL